MTSYQWHMRRVIPFLVVFLAQPILAADLTTLDGLRIHLPRQGTFWYLKTPDIGLDQFVAATITVRDGKIQAMDFRTDKTNYVRVSCVAPVRVQFFQDASGGWGGRSLRSASFEQLEREPVELPTLHLSAGKIEVDSQEIQQIAVRATYSVSLANDMGLGYRTLITLSDPVSVTTKIQPGWKEISLSPRGLVGTATGDVMDDLIGPRVSDRPLTGWSRSKIEDPVRGLKDPRFVRWLRDLRIRP